MQRSDIPTKMPIPFARDADGSHKRIIPASVPIEPGGATFQYGWQNINFLPTDSGGIPPFGQDFNGILDQVTRWLRWEQAGAALRYDATFQSAISGYPTGAAIESGATTGLYWVSTADNNTTNPDSGGANWSVRFFPDPSIAGLIVRSTTSNGAGIRFEGNGTTAQNKTIRVLSGNLEVVNSAYNSVAFRLNDAGDISLVRNISAVGAIQGASVQATNGNVTATGGSLIATFDASIGRNLSVTGNSQVNGVSAFGTSGGFYANPNNAGSQMLQFASNQYLQFTPGVGFALFTTGAIALGANTSIGGSLTTSTNVVAGGAVTATGGVTGATVQSSAGNVTANNGRLRASVGAYLSSDPNAAVLLGDFADTRAGSDGYTYVRFPDGTILQSFKGTTVTGNDDLVLFPFAFPFACANVLAHEGAPGGWTQSGGVQPTVFGTQQISSTGFKLYCAQSVGPNSPVWHFAPGITYRWIAWGY